MIKDIDIDVIVNSEHIKTGSKKSCFDCPIAYAIIEAISKSKGERQYYYRVVSVATSIRMPSEVSRNDIALPKLIEKWIIRFDKGKKVPELHFTIHRTSTYPTVPCAEIINVKFIKPQL